MTEHILKCPKCGKYTMKENCCEKTIPPHPAKYSPEDKYAEYRRRVKKAELEEKDLL